MLTHFSILLTLDPHEGLERGEIEALLPRFIKDLTERERLVEELVEETIGVGPLAPLMADPAVTGILVNGPNTVYVERFGRLETTEVHFRDTAHLLRVVERIAARGGRRIDAASPMA